MMEFLIPHILHSLLPFRQLYLMSLQSPSQSNPFIILYNHRKPSAHQPHYKKTKRRHLDYSTLPHSIIITRRMAAELQHQKQQVEKQLPQADIRFDCGTPQQAGREDGNFFDDQDLDRCIPLDELPQEEFSFHLNDPTLTSNYSKLEKALYCMGIAANCANEEEGLENQKFQFDD